MFGRHFKKEYRRTAVRVYAVDSGEPIGEKCDSFHDPILQIMGVSMALSFAVILLIDKVLPFFGLCEPIHMEYQNPIKRRFIMDNEKQEEFKEKLKTLMRGDIDDLAKTAGILASWMSEQEYTIAEQLTITELIRATVLVAYMTGSIRKRAEAQHDQLQKPAADTFAGELN